VALNYPKMTVSTPRFGSGTPMPKHKSVSILVPFVTCNDDSALPQNPCPQSYDLHPLVAGGNLALKEFLVDGYNNVTIGWIGMGARVKAFVMGRSRGQTPWAPILVYGYNSD